MKLSHNHSPTLHLFRYIYGQVSLCSVQLHSSFNTLCLVIYTHSIHHSISHSECKQEISCHINSKNQPELNIIIVLFFHTILLLVPFRFLGIKVNAKSSPNHFPSSHLFLHIHGQVSLYCVTFQSAVTGMLFRHIPQFCANDIILKSNQIGSFQTCLCIVHSSPSIFTYFRLSQTAFSSFHFTWYWVNVKSSLSFNLISFISVISCSNNFIPCKFILYTCF